jgi:sugar phosphate isomerase/epimerase
VKDVEIGVQTFTYRSFDIAGIVRELKGTGITALEVFPGHLSPQTPAGELNEARKRLSDAGLRVCGTGVCGASFGKPDELRTNLEFAAALGADYVSIDVDPGDAEGKEMLIEVAGELALLLGIHNHGPGHRYDTAQSVLRSCKGYDEILGACLDTGHFLRVDETPEHAIRTLGKRVHAVHLKDFVDAETEVVPGTGKLNYATALAALDKYTNFHNALVIEYEADPANPTPSMRQTVGVLKQALKAEG